MIVFLSWSGERSRLVAQAFDQWIQSVIQAVKPFFSPDDIDKGSFWFVDISDVLKEAKTGVLFVTPENKDRPWLLFEAGALAAKMGKPRIIPLLFDLAPSDLVGPLPHLNAAVFSKDEVRKVVTTLNSQLGEAQLPPDVLGTVFEKWWPELDEKVSLVLKKTEQMAPPARKADDILEEILAISRATQQQVYLIERQNQRPARRAAPFSDFLGQYTADQVETCLHDLPAELRDPVILTDMEGLPLDRVASVLGQDRLQLLSNLNEGRRSLTDMLLERFGRAT